ncbi:hypothetical protein IMSHALPRED_010242 [Imshaugia aleurites]|uniref:Uncharacterized protein n=1 Tax=Imshaugia aleurites TaxID=172621 RepID=A0A8H3G9L4_9LECA|nr:hypothetical protein IMSHALPRED_010242 [Imshaugia aleurites]
MQFSGFLFTLLAFATLTAALPTRSSFGGDFRNVIAKERTQGREVAASESLSEGNTAYRLEVVGVAAFKSERDLDSARPESRSPRSEQGEERPSAVGNRFDKNYDPGNIVENYEDALDVSSSGYVGLGNVVETLD